MRRRWRSGVLAGPVAGAAVGVRDAGREQAVRPREGGSRAGELRLAVLVPRRRTCHRRVHRVVGLHRDLRLDQVHVARRLDRLVDAGAHDRRRGFAERRGPGEGAARVLGAARAHHLDVVTVFRVRVRHDRRSVGGRLPDVGVGQGRQRDDRGEHRHHRHERNELPDAHEALLRELPVLVCSF